ncbi:hypothetical protein GCM10023086_29460 [Streptomyces venetus]|uniref:Uncharacterized protein n=1 Tax=Streptomyces venetus TaxID=1701086 RepID=A0ABP8FS17_9ACTN
MTPRDGEAEAVGDADLEGVGAGETTTDWVPAVVPSEQMTMTVYVPGETFDQAADWLVDVPERVTWRPWAKLPWLLVRSEAVPQLPLTWVQELVVTDTVEPVVLTEMPGPAAAGTAARARGSAAAATVRPERRTGEVLRMLTALRRHGRRYIPCAAEGRERPCCLAVSQGAPGPGRTPGAPVQVTGSFGRPMRGGPLRPGCHLRAPVVTVRSAEKPPHVPSGSIARIRTRRVTPETCPA